MLNVVKALFRSGIQAVLDPIPGVADPCGPYTNHQVARSDFRGGERTVTVIPAKTTNS